MLDELDEHDILMDKLDDADEVDDELDELVLYV